MLKISSKRLQFMNLRNVFVVFFRIKSDAKIYILFSEWNEESSVITLQLGNSTQSQQTGNIIITFGNNIW